MVVDPTTILQNSQIEVQSGQVLRLIESPTEPADLRLTGKTVLPGLINCHTHLEFSDLTQPIPANAAFPEWIAAVIRHRRDQLSSLNEDQLLQTRFAAIQSGIVESWKYGTAALVDIATQPHARFFYDSPWQAITDNQASLRSDADSAQVARLNALPEMLCLPEVIGLDEKRFQQTLQWAGALRDSVNSSTPECDAMTSQSPSSSSAQTQLRAVGISPHAPYSLMHPEAIQQVAKLDRTTLIAMHVAESLDELEWAKFASGSFREVYSRIGLPLAQDRMQIDQAIELLSRFDRALLVHGNYLTVQQLDQVAQSTTAIVYCPRTHRHFQHQTYPLAEILQRDIPLLLGTDSRASNPNLDMWMECRQAAVAHPDWPAADLLAAATTRAAEYLGISDRLGSLNPGKRFVARCLDTPTGASKGNLLEQLLRH